MRNEKRERLIAAMAAEGYVAAPDDWPAERFDATAGHLYVTEDLRRYASALDLPDRVMGWWFVPAAVLEVRA